MATKQRSGGLTTLQRGLLLLELIAQADGEATAKQLGEQTGIKIGTCYHLLRTLVEEGYVIRLGAGRYSLGHRIASLQARLRERQAPDPAIVSILRTLWQRVDETTYLTGWYGDEIVLQTFLPGSHAVSVRNLDIGYAGNVHARASCRAMLALLGEDKAKAMLENVDRPMMTRHTITDLEALLVELRLTVDRGFAVDREEFADGVCCIGAAFLDRTGFPCGSYTVSVPLHRFEAQYDFLGQSVVEAAQSASRYLGYSQSAGLRDNALTVSMRSS
jgi:IclR family acetate operon transcriptional repressor